MINRRLFNVKNGPRSVENGLRVGVRRGTSQIEANWNLEKISRQVNYFFLFFIAKNSDSSSFIEIKQLFGHDPSFKWKCTVLVFVQVASLYYLQEKSIPFLIFAAYFFGGVINHSLSLAVHEISHNLSFGHGRWVIKPSLHAMQTDIFLSISVQWRTDCSVSFATSLSACPCRFHSKNIILSIIAIKATKSSTPTCPLWSKPSFSAQPSESSAGFACSPSSTSSVL